MELQQVSPQEYGGIITHPYHVFNSVDFNVGTGLARNLPIVSLLFKKGGYKLGIIGSNAGGKFRSPFSAPFGGFSFKSADLDISDIEEAVSLLTGYCSAKDFKCIEFVLPPVFYAPNFISKLGNVLYRKGFMLFASDLNYSIHTGASIGDYMASLAYNAKKNLQIALAKPFHLRLCRNATEQELAYDIIRQNRALRGYPLRMTWEDVMRTTGVVEADFFLLYLEGFAVAAALVFHVAPGIVQVIYWGDLPAYAGNKCMNYLAYGLVEHYLEPGINIIDVGPSTEDSQPNYGLCSFKESIGCKIYRKESWRLDL